MVKDFRFIIFFIFLTFFINAKDSEYLLQKIILIKPEMIPDDSVEAFFFDETGTLLEEMDAHDEIIYLKKSKWKRFKRLLNYNDFDDLGNFYFKTSVTGILQIFVEEKENQFYKIIISIYNINEKKEIKEHYYFTKDLLIKQLEGYKKFLKNILLEQFPKNDINEIKSKKYKIPPFLRINPDYQLLLSGGNGFYFKQINLGMHDLFAFGMTTYITLSTIFKNFSFNTHFEFTCLGNESPYEEYLRDNKDENKDDGDTFTTNLFFSMSFNGWVKNQVFKIGGGFAIARGTMYLLEDYEYWDGEYHRGINVEHLDYVLLFLFISISAQPRRNAIITFDIGSYLSPSHIETVGFSNIIFYYLRLNFKYFFYKNLFVEFDYPFYAMGFRTKHSHGSEPNSHIMFNIGLGWRFEWSKQ